MKHSKRHLRKTKLGQLRIKYTKTRSEAEKLYLVHKAGLLAPHLQAHEVVAVLTRK